MEKEPDIISELRKQEKQGLLKKNIQSTFEEINTIEKTTDDISSKTEGIIDVYHESNYSSYMINENFNNETNEDLELINSINNLANHGAAFEEIIKKINEKTVKLFSCNGASIYLLSEDKNFLNLQNINISDKQDEKIEELIGKKIPSINIPLTEKSLYWNILKKQKPCIINDKKIIQNLAAECTPNKILKKLVPKIFSIIKINSIIVAPLISNNELLGLMDISRNIQFNENELHRFEIISNHFSGIIQRKNAEDKLQRIISHSNEVFYLHDNNHNLSFVSPQCEKIFGYTQEEMMMKWTSLLTDNPINKIGFNLTKKAIETGEKQKSYLLEILKKDGEKIIVRINESPVKNDHGIVIGITGILNDVTEELKRNRQLNILSSVVEQSNNSVAILDLEGKIEYVNPKLLSVYGSKFEDIKGKHWISWLSKNSTLKEKIHEIRDTVLNKGKIWIGEVNDKDKNGNIVWRDASIFPIKNDNGDIIKIVYTSVDITDRKEIEKKLSINKEHFKNLFNTIVDPVVIVDSKGKFLEITDKVEEVTGFKKEELIGKNFLATKIVSRKSKALLIKNLIKRMSSAKISPYEIDVLTKEGKKLPFEVNASKINYMDKSADMVVFRDITKRKELQLNLIKNEEKFRNFFENEPEYCYIVSPDGKILDINSSALKTLGYKKEEIIGKPLITTIYTPSSQEKAKLLLNKCKEAGILRNEGLNISTKTGEIRDVLLSADSVKDSMGQIIHSISVQRDITDINKTKKSLQESEDRYKDLIDIAPDGIITLDKKGFVTSCNSAFLKLTGFKENEIIGRHYIRLPTLTMRSISKSMKLYKNFLKGQDQNLFDFEWKHKDGRIRLGEARARSIIKDGKTIGLLAVVRDVTELRKADEILRASEEKYRMIFNNVNDEIVYLDRYGKILDVNPRSKDIFGYGPKELIGKKFSDIGFFEGKNLTKNLKLFKKLVIYKESVNLENLEIIHKNGSMVFADVNVKPIVKDGKLKAIVVIARDVTEQKKAEKETEEANKLLKEINMELETKVMERTKDINNLLRQKDEFINQLGHDLKNPLTPLVNLLPIIESKEKDLKTKKLLSVVNRNVGYMKNLVTKTIEIARLNSLNAQFNFEDTNLLAEFNKVLEANKIGLDEKNIHLVNNISDDIWVSVDRLRLEELLNNLLNNSVKYSNNSGCITIDVKLDRGIVTTSLTDTGIGMNLEQLSHIFDEFYKADESRHDFESSGLGLSICKRIVECHGGRIWVESQGEGKGSTFYFTLKAFSQIRKKQKKGQPERISFIKHKGKEILYLDYSNLKAEEYQSAVDDIIDYVINLEKYNLLVLTNVHGNYFTAEYIKNTKKAGKMLEPYLEKNAIVGFTKKQDIFLKAVKLFSGISIKPFENIESAKDWLVE